MKLLIVAVLAVALSGCSVSDSVRDGAIADLKVYCSNRYKLVRGAGRLAADMAGVKIPNVCKGVWKKLQSAAEEKSDAATLPESK